MALGTFTMTGETGDNFEFVAYRWDEDFEPIGAVYIITKCIPELRGHLHCSPIYVGQTHDLSIAICDDICGENCPAPGRVNNWYVEQGTFGQRYKLNGLYVFPAVIRAE